MRNRYVQPDQYLTPFGQWLAARIPHTCIRRDPWGRDPDSVVVRVFGFKPYYRFIVFDFTRAFRDWHLTICNIPIKKNRAFVAR